MRLDDPPNWGSLTVRFIEAEFDKEYVDAPPHTYCVVWLLEKVRWRRRKSKPRGRGPGEDPMHPVWGDEFIFDDVRDDSKLALDVWNVKQEPGADDEFFGKVWLHLSEAIRKPVTAWHELVPGRVQVLLTWTPYEGDELGDAVALTLPPPMPRALEDAPTGGSSLAGLPPISSSAAGRAAPKSPPKPAAADDADEEIDLEELPDESPKYDDDFEDEPSPPKPPKPAAAAAARGKIEYHEYTHRGGTGHGPKENQDAYFVQKIDDSNFLFGVFDGHGHDK